MFFVIVSHEMHVRTQLSEDTLTLKCAHPFLNLPFPKSVTQIYKAVPTPSLQIVYLQSPLQSKQKSNGFVPLSMSKPLITSITVQSLYLAIKLCNFPSSPAQASSS